VDSHWVLVIGMEGGDTGVERAFLGSDVWIADVPNESSVMIRPGFDGSEFIKWRIINRSTPLGAWLVRLRDASSGKSPAIDVATAFSVWNMFCEEPYNMEKIVERWRASATVPETLKPPVLNRTERYIRGYRLLRSHLTLVG
jgi:hypothetical protein